MSIIQPNKIDGDINFASGALLLVFKPLEWTSFDVVKKIRNLIKNHMNVKKIKVGHTGTLDPLAVGLIVICTGKFTKRILEIQNQDKEYMGKFRLGATTPSFDRETKINNTYDITHITKDLIKETTKQFIGKIKQTPPIYSALKINGKRLYNYARRDESVEIKQRSIIVEAFEITKIELPNISFKIKCSKGTYIRCIANDFGKALKSGAYLTELCRTKIGSYDISEAVSLKEVEERIKLL